MIKVTDNKMVEVNVPQFIRGIQVTSVGQESILDVNPPGFWECEKLRKVIIPEGVKVIGGFNRCVSLTQISLPDTVTDIVSNAFDCCFKLESIRIPRRLKKIGTRAFSDNQAALRLYEKNGFKVDKEKKLSLMRLLGSGYPVKLRRVM